MISAKPNILKSAGILKRSNFFTQFDNVMLSNTFWGDRFNIPAQRCQHQPVAFGFATRNQFKS